MRKPQKRRSPPAQAEQAPLRTAERLTNLLAVLCVVGWRVFWLTMVNRATPDAPAETVLTASEAVEKATADLRNEVEKFLVKVAV